MIVYQLEDPDYGWLTYDTLESAIDTIREEIDANSLFPCDLTITVKLVEMSQEEIDNLPEVEL